MNNSNVIMYAAVIVDYTAASAEFQNADDDDEDDTNSSDSCMTNRKVQETHQKMRQRT